MARIRRGVTFRCQYKMLKRDELAEPGLFLWIRKIGAGGADEAHVGDVGFLGSVYKFKRDIIFVGVRRWNEADGIDAHVLQLLRHHAFPARLMRNYRGAQAFQMLDMGVFDIQSQSNYRSKAFREVWVGEE
jgi:hypothetical protein